MKFYFLSKISSALAFCLVGTSLNAHSLEDVQYTTLDDTDQGIIKRSKLQGSSLEVQDLYPLNVTNLTTKNTLLEQSIPTFKQTGVLDVSANTTETITDLSTFAYSAVNLGESSILNLGSNGDERLDPTTPVTINFNGADSKAYGGSTYNGRNNININVEKSGFFYLPNDRTNGTLYLKSLSLQNGSSMSFVGGTNLEFQTLTNGENTALSFSTNNQFDSSQTVYINNQVDGGTFTLELTGHKSSSSGSLYGTTLWFKDTSAQNILKHLTINDGYHQIFLKGSLTIKDKFEISSSQVAQRYITFAFNDNKSENILRFEKGVDVGGSASATFYFFDGIGKIITQDNILNFNEGYIGFKFSPNSTGAFSYLLDDQGNIGKIINGTTTAIEFRGGDSTFVANIHTIDTQTQGKSPGYTNFQINDYANSAKHYGNITSEGLGKNYLSFFNKQYEKGIAFYGESIHFSKIQFYGEKAFLTLDSSHNNVIMQVDNIEKLSTSTATSGILHLNFRSQDNLATFNLGGKNNVFKSITVESGENNTLAITQEGGKLEVDESINIGVGKGIAFNLSSSSNTVLASGLNNDGNTKISFVGNNSASGSGTFNGNITTGATTTPSLLAGGGQDASLAKTTITFTDGSNKASSVTWSGDIVANNGGINEFVISDGLAFNANTDGLVLQGSGGNNQINFLTTGKTLTIRNSDASTLQNILTKGAKSSISFASSVAQASVVANSISTLAENTGTITEIDLNSGAESIIFSLYNNESSKDVSHLGTIFTIGKDSSNQGITHINFKDGTSTLQANIQTDSYGITNLNFGSSSDVDSVVATIDGVISNTDIQNPSDILGTARFNINAKSVRIQRGADGSSFSSGTNEINFENTTGATLSWKDGAGSDFQTITTTGGTTNINFNNSGTIAGDSTKASIDTNGANASTTITLVNLSQTPAGGVENRSARNTSGVNALIQGAVTTTDGTTTIKFSDGSGAKTLTLGAGGNTLSSIALGDGSSATTNNTLALSTGNTEIVNAVNVTTIQALDFNLENGVNLTLTNGLTTNGGETTFNFNGDTGILTASQAISTTSGTTTFNLGSSSSVGQDTGSVTITIDGKIGNTDGTQDDSGRYNGGENFFSINAKDITLKSGDSGLVFNAGLNVIEFANTNGATLNWQNKNGNAQAIQTTGGSTTIKFSNSGTIEGAVSTTGGNTTFEIDNNAYAVVTGNVTTGAVSSGGSQVGGMTPKVGTASTNVDFTGNGALVLRGVSNNISNVTLGNGTYILSLTDGINNGGADKRDYRRTLVIDNITTGSGSLTLGTQTTATEADTFIIKGASGSKQGTYHFGIIAEDGVKLEEIGAGESGAVRLASVANSAGISFESKSKIISGFTIADANITHTTTDENGNKTGSEYTSYYIGAVSDVEVIAAEQEITATAFTLNYDLYMANLNSLNKRMGELRENAHSQGVWARVFNGALTNSFGLESKSNYTTIQAGYDYAFGFEGANNYLGVALSYALSTSTSQNAFDSEGQKRGIDNVYSNAVEVALYNSYVSDSGWYNDTIAKFSYIMSKFDISNLNTGSVTNNDTTNFAFTLSDEVGYVFKLGENKEWSITPQVEATFGYFNQSDFKQTLADSTSYLASSADAVLTLRTRAGSAFAYDFKNFTQKDTFNASVYIGAFYEYDYVSGGGITLSTDQINGVENILSDLSSDGRAVMNVGTNMSIKDNTRLYFDFEKSFGGKINTDYQVNFGVRYSFGESNGYTPMIEKAEFKAPLKVEGEEAKEENNEIKENKEKQESEKTQQEKEAKAESKTQESIGKKKENEIIEVKEKK